MSKWNTLLITLLTLGLLISACSIEDAAEGTMLAEDNNTAINAAPVPADTAIQVTDALNREITFTTPPERIILTGKAWFMLGGAVYAFPEAAEKLVALGEAPQGAFIPAIDPYFENKPILMNDTGAEEIASFAPDVVFLKSYLADSLGTPLEILGIPVVYLDLETPDQYQRDLETLGAIFQNPQRAQDLASYYQRKTAAVESAVADLAAEDKPQVLFLYYSDRDGEVAFNVPPVSWMQTIIFKLAGGIPVWEDIELGRGWTKVNLEQVAVWDPDQIFLVSYHSDIDKVIEDLRANSTFQSLRAVQEEQLYAFPGDYYTWDQPDPRWILGLEWLATRMHPQLFADMDIEQEAREFFEFVYDLDESGFEDLILAQIHGDYP